MDIAKFTRETRTQLVTSEPVRINGLIVDATFGFSLIYIGYISSDLSS